MRRRHGFSLVEMLVAMALIIFIMVILTQAFVAGLEAFRTLKGIGDMEEKLRNASTLLRRDLTNLYLKGPGSERKLSEPYFWDKGPPEEGFFRLWHGSYTYTPPAGPGSPFLNPPWGGVTPVTNQINRWEGFDAEGNPSYRSVNHILHFTTKLRGNRREDFLPARVPIHLPFPLVGPPTRNPLLLNPDMTNGNQPSDRRYQDDPDTAIAVGGTHVNYTGQLAEVCYFLRYNGNAAGATPLYTLYRRQLLVTPDTATLNRTTTGTTMTAFGPMTYNTPITVLNGLGLVQFAEMSCKTTPDTVLTGGYPRPLYFNSAADLTIPPRRFGMLPTPPVTTSPPPSPWTVAENAGLPNVPLLPYSSSSTYYNATYPCLGESEPPLGLTSPPGPPATPVGAPSTWPPVPPTMGVPVPWQDHPALPGDTGLRGADVLLTDVISFDVRVLTDETYNRINTRPDIDPFVDLFDSIARVTLDPSTGGATPPVSGLQQSRNSAFRPLPGTYGTPTPYYDGPAVFDTWTSRNDGTYDYRELQGTPPNPLWMAPTGLAINSMAAPLQIRIIALQITLRVWNPKTQQTRQVTLVQYM